MPCPDAVKSLFDGSMCGTWTTMLKSVQPRDTPCYHATAFALIVVHKHELILVDLAWTLSLTLESGFFSGPLQS